MSSHLQLEKYEVVEDCRVIWHMSLKEIHPGYFYTFQLREEIMKITLGTWCLVIDVIDIIFVVVDSE